MSNKKQIRVLIAKPGLDGHDRGAKIVARALRDAGMKIIYTGIRQTPEMIAQAAVQEDVDIIGLSILSGAHLETSARLMECLKERQIEDVPVIIGGIIPEEDADALKRMGIRAVFGPGASTKDIAEAVKAIGNRHWATGNRRDGERGGGEPYEPE